MNDLVSIIVPVYNVEKYLEKCLNSIVNQTYKNIEIICIDDGSPDNSINILNKFAEEDKRLKIIRQKNQGLSAARNTGIINSIGKYIIFIDSDDWIEDNMIEFMLNEIQKDDKDISICGQYNHYFYKNNESIKKITLDKFQINIFQNYNDYFIENYKLHFPFGSSWNKLFKKELIIKNNLFFEKGRFHEDLLFVFRYLNLVQKIGVVKTPLYHYIVTRGNSITNKINKNEINDVLFTVYELKKILNEKLLCSVEYNEYIFQWIIRATILKFSNFKEKSIQEEFENRIEILKNDEEYRKICKVILKKSKNLKIKVFIIIFNLNNILFKFLLLGKYYKNILSRSF